MSKSGTELMPLWKQIIEKVEEVFGVNVFEDNSTRKIVTPRFVCMALMKNKGVMKITAIGRLFGKHHSTVIYAQKQVSDLFDTDEEIRNKIIQIENYFE